MKYLHALVVGGLVFLPTAGAQAGALAVDLGDAGGFAVLAGSTVTNSGSSVVNGNLGIWPGASITGFGPGMVVNGSIYTADMEARFAQEDLTHAYNIAAAEQADLSLTGLGLGGMTLLPGVYNFASSAQLTGMLTLNAGGQSNVTFIFQIGSTLVTAANSVVQLINAGSGDSVIWQVGSSATLGVGSQFAGDILALDSISLNSGSDISCGAALAINGAVTLESNNISTGGDACPTSQTPVPEPASYTMLAAACACIGFARRRNGRSERSETLNGVIPTGLDPASRLRC